MPKMDALEIELTRGKLVGLIKSIHKDFGQPKSLRLLGVYAPPLNSRDDNMLVAKVLIRAHHTVGTTQNSEKVTYGYKYGSGWSRV